MANKQLLQQISFDLYYLYPGKNPQTIDLLVSDKTDRLDYIDSNGARRQTTKLPKDATVATFLVSDVVPFPEHGKDAVRVKRTVTYWPAEYEANLDESAKTQNIIAREAHNLLIRHQSIVLRMAAGQPNENPNQTGQPYFELRENTKIVRAQIEKDKKIAQAMTTVQELYERPEEFIDMCYGYGIQPIENIPVEVLLNEVNLKIKNNPDHFLKTIAHADAKMLVLVKRGMQATAGGVELINFENDFFFYRGEPVGQNDEQIVAYFKTHPREKEFLMQQLGIALERVVEEIPTLAPDAVPDNLSPRQEDNRARNNANRELTMRRSMDKVFNKLAYDKAENKAFGSKEQKEYDDIVAEKREAYKDILDAFDTYVAKRREDVR